MDVQISKGRSATWLNGRTKCIARFTEGGYEVFSDNPREIDPLVVFKTNIQASIYLWYRFKDAVKTAHRVVLEDKDAPAYLRPSLGIV